MGIDAKETIVILWRVLSSTMSTSIRFMRNHPILSSVSMFLLLLYIFLPSLLFFLIYSSPVLACAVVYAREKLGLRFSGCSHKSAKRCGDGGGEGGGEDVGGVVVRSHLRQQRSVRRNARMKVEEWDSQTSEDEKDKVILTSLYNDLLGRTPHFEESPKALEDNDDDIDKALVKEEEEEDSCDLGNNVEVVEKPKLCCDCENNEEKHREMDSKEEKREEMSNVNEHGISEIERNQRLESLIARRKARRLFKLALDQRNKLQAEESTTFTHNNNSNNLQITVPKNNSTYAFEKRRSYPQETTITGLQIPGSAPSVLLQGRNPFDIPYDPQEERPILTGDSFDEEFSLFNHKDVFFCRHESFCRFALFSPEHAQCMNSPVPASDISDTRKHLDLENEYMDHSEEKLPCNDKEATIEDDKKSVESGKSVKREVETNDETDSSNVEGDDSSSSEESESELRRLNNVELREAIYHSMDNYSSAQTRSNIPSPLPRGLVPPRLDDNNAFYSRRCGNSHSRTFSVASDMQVEVSELGSPPTTVDWLDDWSAGGESYIYDTDIEREIVRNEESRKKVSHSGIGSKEENSGSETKLVAKPDQKSKSDEQLRVVDDNSSSLHTRSQSEEIFAQKPSSSSDVSKTTSSGKLGGLLFNTSVSLSSITEEPEIVLDSIDRRISEHMKGCTEELTDHISLPSLDSSMEKLIDKEVADVQELDNVDQCGSPKIIDSNIIDHQQEDQVLNIIQGENDREIINVKKYENMDPREYEVTQSFMDASLDTPYIETSEREMEEEEEEEPNLDIFTSDITKHSENEAFQSDLKSSQGEVMEDNDDWDLVENTDEETKPTEQEKTDNVFEASSSHPHPQLVDEAYGNAENANNVILLQVQDANNSTPDKLTDREISKEEENPGLLENVYAESAQEYDNRASVKEEPIVSADSPSSQDSQPLIQQSGVSSSEGTLEMIQQTEHEDGIASNTISEDIVKDEFAAVAKDSAASESNNEENLKRNEEVEVGEAMKKELELNLESMHHNNGLVAKEEDDVESKKVIEAMLSAEVETTEDENRVLEENK